MSSREQRKRELQRLLSHDELKSRKGIRYSRMHLRRLMAAKKFPQAVKSGHYISWLEVEIDDYIAELAAARHA